MNAHQTGLFKWAIVLLLVVGLFVAVGVTTNASSDDISPLETVVMGQSQWLSGAPASLRVISTHHETGLPVKGAVHITLTPSGDLLGGPTRLYDGRLTDGTLQANFHVPDLPPGAYQLSVRTVTNLGIDDIKETVSLHKETQILLTADKPLYQPGQTIHLRALALRRPALSPAAQTPITFEVDDAKGNKVFKKTINTSKFGVASAEFVLADEINLGRYTLRAVSEFGSSDRTVEVKRYVLPKFKLALTTDRPYYLPGETLSGTLQADYFFGKPTSRSDVVISLASFDVEFKEFAEIKGRTDDNGTFEFETVLPDYFVGLPLEQGNAFVKIDIELTDRADHTEKITQTVPIAKDPLVITAVPESGLIKPGLDNNLYILVSSPDGKPLQGASVNLNLPQSRTILARTTDAAGICEASIKGQRGNTQLEITAKHSGRSAAKSVNFRSERFDNSLLLRAARAIAKVGDSLDLSVISTKQSGTTYIDVIRDNQTVLTRAVDLAAGRADFELPLSHDLQGTLQIHAYQILPDENIIRDTRLIYVEPADDLVVEVRPNQDTYRPGDTAQLQFTVRDAAGRPAQAALGLTIVDESVFALQEMQPGLERIYFALEKELLTPRYEIHGFTHEGVISGRLPFEPDKPADDALRQRAAAVLFAAAEQSAPIYSLSANTYQQRLEKMQLEWIKEIGADAEIIDNALNKYYQRHRQYLAPNGDIQTLVRQRLLKPADLLDRWGTPYRVRWRNENCWLSSAGPDRRWDTGDDFHGIGQWAVQGLRPRRGGGGPRLERLAEPEEMLAADFTAAGEPRVMALAEAPNGGLMVKAKGLPGPAGAPESPQVRLRQFFPETMYVNPSLITDDRGRADLSVEMADSITTWRLQALASSQHGQLGSTTQGLRVFQDFFIDIDLPVALTQNDEVSIPIAVYNYLPQAQTINLTLETPGWFELVGDTAEKSLDIAASDINVVYYRLRAKQIGRQPLTVHAQGSHLGDAIRRRIEILPDGQEQRNTWNDRLEGTVTKSVNIPINAVPDASTILVKIYPGLLSQAVEGLDSLLRMPFGCFEQTSSVTYPNILVLDYLKKTNKAKPELQMKAEQYINVGYQRLISFEVDGGGFSWFGNAPAHKILTSYGLLEFRDMSRVHPVDEAIITRTQNWLASLQNPDGSWSPDQGGIAEGIINRQTDTLRSTAYILWALAESGYQGPALEKGQKYLDKNWQNTKDSYALAVIGNAYLSANPKSESAGAVIEALAKLAVVEDKTAYWETQAPTFTSAQNATADLETTALAAYTLIKSGRHTALTNKAITYLIQSKDSFGTWQTTQATVWALKALLLSLEKSAEEIDADVIIHVNDQQAASFRITQDDYEVVRQLDAKSFVKSGANNLRISIEGRGSALYQIVAKYYLPWKIVTPPAQELLSINLDYDRTQLAANDLLTASVSVVNNDPRTCNMLVIDLGLPPGFELMTEDLVNLVEHKKIQKFTLAARQIIIYLDKLESKKPLNFTYRLRAKFPVKAAAPASKVYRYYNPEISATAAPVELEVTQK